MKRPAVHNSFRIAFISFGICCFIFACVKLSAWIGYKKADSIVELVQPASLKAGTNAFIQVTFMRPSGSQGFVPFPERSLPANVRPGDHVSVLYDPDGGYGVIYSFYLVWRIPMYAAILGAASISLGVFFRRRSGGLFRVSNEHAV